MDLHKSINEISCFTVRYNYFAAVININHALQTNYKSFMRMCIYKQWEHKDTSAFNIRYTQLTVMACN